MYMQLLNVYAPRYESAGKFWPVVHDSTIFSLVLMQFIAFGIFTLKKLPHATSATLPLPILTLLFNEYCRKRFLPIFMAYSTEVCYFFGNMLEVTECFFHNWIYMVFGFAF